MCSYSRRGHLPVIEILVAAGVNLKLRGTDVFHFSAFDAAAIFGHANVLGVLVRHGEDVNAFGDETGMSDCTLLVVSGIKAFGAWWTSC